MQYKYNIEHDYLEVDAGKVVLKLFFDAGDFSYIVMNDDQQFTLADDCLLGLFVAVGGTVRSLYSLIFTAINDYAEVVAEHDLEWIAESAHARFCSSPSLTGRA
jgi:hypothetical protein